jgi:hypothetical protein
MDEHDAPTRTPINPLTERILRWISGSGRGQAFGRWLSKLIALPQLGRLSASSIPWTPLSCPIARAKVAIVTTSGVHLTADKPFLLNSDSSFRVIPGMPRPPISRLPIRHTTERTPYAISTSSSRWSACVN